jgi:hypothetical protein
LPVPSVRLFGLSLRSTLLFSVLAAGAQTTKPTPEPANLPDAPSAVASAQQDDDDPDAQRDVIQVAEESFKTSGNRVEPCTLTGAMRMVHIKTDKSHIGPVYHPCAEIFNPYQRFLNTTMPIPLTPKQKGYLAIHNVTDPFNFLTIVGTSAFTIGIDSHTAYGPSWGGFAQSASISLLQDATGEFFGTFLIPSLAHEDPHYHRMPNASIARRTLHAVSRTVIAQSDEGANMPNYAALLTYPIATEFSNLYVPGIHTDAQSTVDRILTGYALDPVNNLVTEFLPDVAKRIHIRVIFVQRILNQVAASPPGTP